MDPVTARVPRCEPLPRPGRGATLTDAERDALAAAFGGSTRNPEHLVFLVAPVVERIIADRIGGTSKEAADV